MDTTSDAAKGASKAPKSPTGVAPSASAGIDENTSLPDCAPIPASALCPQMNELGYHVAPIGGNLYWVTDGGYQSMFLSTRSGVVLVGPR